MNRRFTAYFASAILVANFIVAGVCFYPKAVKAGVKLSGRWVNP